MTSVNNVSGPNTASSVTSEPAVSPAATPAAFLPDPLAAMAMGDDMIAQVVAMMAKSFREDRKEARKLNRLEENNIAKETAAKVKSLRDKADQIRKEGFATGMSMMVGGALTAGGAAMSLARVGQSPTRAPQWSALGSGCGDGVKGMGQFVAAGHRSAQTEAEGEAARHDGHAEAAKRRAVEYTGAMDDARRMLDKVAEFLKSVRDSQNASTQAAMRRA